MTFFSLSRVTRQHESCASMMCDRFKASAYLVKRLRLIGKLLSLIGKLSDDLVSVLAFSVTFFSGYRLICGIVFLPDTYNCRGDVPINERKSWVVVSCVLGDLKSGIAVLFRDR